MNFITKILSWCLRKSIDSLLKTQAKQHGYIIRQGKSVYVYLHDAKTKTKQWKDITEEFGSGPIADEMYSILEEAIEKNQTPVKYRCTKCQTTLVDSTDELISFGGLGNWCQECVDKSA